MVMEVDLSLGEEAPRLGVRERRWRASRATSKEERGWEMDGERGLDDEGGMDCEPGA